MSSLLTRGDRGTRLVVEDDELKGMVSLEDLRELVALRLELEKSA